uniref:Uncharacterized protein n=1 Tax=Solanum tuberosum TaxID=4113 RepID=M1DU92_SOLTU
MVQIFKGYNLDSRISHFRANLCLEIPWNDLSNAAEFSQFRVCMSELFPLEVGLLAGQLARILRVRDFLREERKEEEKEKKKQGFVKIVVVSAELRKSGQGFAWGPSMVFECRPQPGCRLGA